MPLEDLKNVLILFNTAVFMKYLHRLFFCLFVISSNIFPDSYDQIHKELLKKANLSVNQAASHAEADPLRPIYHLTTAAYWINDPNGPIYYNGQYHMFFQSNPYGSIWGNMSWAHAVSEDLVHWKHLPIALVPVPGTCDKDGVFSGCCIIDNEGIPTIVYTGVWPEVVCLAKSYDNMLTWTKYENNPVIDKPPFPISDAFRDPFVWKEKDCWYLILGAYQLDKTAGVLLYKSKNLTEWEYLHPLYEEYSEKDWECPNFFSFENKCVLVISPEERVKYVVGEYKNLKFEPSGQWVPLDLAQRNAFYAPNNILDNKNRRILWGWVSGGGTSGMPWNGILTLPRVMTLRDDGMLGMAPLPELQKLRKKHYQLKDFELLKDIRGDALEIIVEIENINAESFGLEVLLSFDEQEKTPIVFYPKEGLFSAGYEGGPFQLLDDEKTLKLHIFVDKSVIETYINDRACITCRAYPKKPDSKGVRLFSYGGQVKIRSLDVWEMGSIWKK